MTANLPQLSAISRSILLYDLHLPCVQLLGPALTVWFGIGKACRYLRFLRCLDMNGIVAIDKFDYGRLSIYLNLKSQNTVYIIIIVFSIFSEGVSRVRLGVHLINSHRGRWSPTWVHSGRRPLLVPVPAPSDSADGEFSGMKIDRGNRSTQKTCPTRHFIHHKSHLTRPGC
jgi:hypothetical protein